MQYQSIEVEFLRELCQEQQEEIERLNERLDDVLAYLENLRGGV